MGEGPVAAIDCGSNSTRLLIRAGDGRTLERTMTITRLGAGVDGAHLLARASMDRVLATLATYRASLDAAGVVAARMVATSAVRDARNGQAFLDEASRVLGAPCVCLTGTEEAAASYRGATDDLPASSVRRLVLDIGGGSTELIVEGPSGLESTSLQLGCVRNTERFLHSDPPTQDELQALADHVHALLDEGLVALPSLAGGGPIEVVGLAGTVASLVMVDRGLRAYDRSVVHHARLDRADVARWTDALAAVPAAERHARFGVEVGRADVLVGGLVVLGAVMDRVGATSLLHSEADILDGVAAGLAEEVRS